MIWALSDPHLSGGVENKEMDKFGSAWIQHQGRIETNWREQVQEEDWVLLPGDISWGMSLQEACPDLQFLNRLPGQKYLGRGNHDYWWTTLKKLEEFKQAQQLNSLHFMRQSCYALETQNQKVWLCGTRGWLLPGEREFGAQDKKIFAREVQRLEHSLKLAQQLAQKGEALVCALHYPPLLRTRMQSELTDLLEAYKIPLCIYGHLHGRGLKEAVQGLVRGVYYQNVAADALDMQPLILPLCCRIPFL